MTAQERHVSQQQESASALRTHDEEKSSRLDARKKPDEAGSLKTIARSLGNRAMSNLLVEGHDGSPLEPAFREQMERGLGADLSQVRVHGDAGAQTSASKLDAEAFTRGKTYSWGGMRACLIPQPTNNCWRTKWFTWSSNAKRASRATRSASPAIRARARSRPCISPGLGRAERKRGRWRGCSCRCSVRCLEAVSPSEWKPIRRHAQK